MRQRAIGIVLVFVSLFLANYSRAESESIEFHVDRCVMVFSRTGQENQTLVFRPAHIDVQMRTTIRNGQREPLSFETRTMDSAETADLRVELTRGEGGVNTRWWIGARDEFMDFPMEFVEGDWEGLVAGSETELLAPEDILSRVRAHVTDSQLDPVRYFHSTHVERNAPEGGTLRVQREQPFRPRFILKDGFLSAEGILASSVITLETHP